jgi:amino acid transporter
VTISSRLGSAVTAGVPVLVLVSLGPVSGLAGTASVLVWTVSAVMGFFMALVFAELAVAFPHRTGGIGVLAARVWAPRSRLLAMASQWGYWFGWSPALAINGVLLGGYLRRTFAPAAPGWVTIALAAGVLALSVTINHYGLLRGARVQVALAAIVAAGVLGLLAAASLGGRFRWSNLTPLQPPSGWASTAGTIAIAGALFVAGWSTYGAELALSYGTEYHNGARDAADAAVVIALLAILAYTAVPLVVVGVLGAGATQDDPVAALSAVLRDTGGVAEPAVVAGLMTALLLCLNTVMIGSSRTLYQMSLDGSAWRFLGRLNRHGVPANALRFDMAVNVGLLAVVLAGSRGRTAGVPIALLAAANVGYFTAVSLALLAGWLHVRSRPPAHRGPLRLRPTLMRVGVVLAVVNLGLLAAAGLAWGWFDVTVGVVILAGVVLLATPRRPAPSPPLALRRRPVCMAWGAPSHVGVPPVAPPARVRPAGRVVTR